MNKTKMGIRPKLNTIVRVQDEYDSFNYEGIFIAEHYTGEIVWHSYEILVTKIIKATNPEVLTVGNIEFPPANRYTITTVRDLTKAEKLLYAKT